MDLCECIWSMYLKLNPYVCVYLYTSTHTHKYTYTHIYMERNTKFSIQLSVTHMFKYFPGSVYVPIKYDIATVARKHHQTNQEITFLSIKRKNSISM